MYKKKGGGGEEKSCGCRMSVCSKNWLAGSRAIKKGQDLEWGKASKQLCYRPAQKKQPGPALRLSFNSSVPVLN